MLLVNLLNDSDLSKSNFYRSNREGEKLTV